MKKLVLATNHILIQFSAIYEQQGLLAHLLICCKWQRNLEAHLLLCCFFACLLVKLIEEIITLNFAFHQQSLVIVSYTIVLGHFCNSVFKWLYIGNPKPFLTNQTFLNFKSQNCWELQFWYKVCLHLNSYKKL